MNGRAPQVNPAEREPAPFARSKRATLRQASEMSSPLTATAPVAANAPRTASEGRSIPWYRLPILWLGAVIFGASVAGCVLMILLGSHHADEPLPDAGMTLLKMPLGTAPSQDPSRGTQ